MLGRVTQQYMVQDFNANLRSRQDEIQKVETRLSSGYRVNLPSEDPVATINFMDYDTRLKEIGTYKSIIDSVQGKLKMVDSSLDSATQILQRLRELAVQGANGTYTKEERQNMAVEVDQMLRELVSLANTYYKGDALFGGTMTDESPFKTQTRTDSKTGIDFLEEVRYIGNNQTQIAEVDRGDTVVTTQPGNQVFWADNMMIYSTLNVANYMAPSDSTIVVDGIDVAVKQGDNLEVIADKINKSGAAVNAAVMNKDGQSYFTLESTSPHQISLLDTNGGKVLQDLGIIDNGMQGPNNYSPAAKVFTGSVFDVMINFRKALMDDNVFHVGGTAIGGLDMSLANLLKYRANMGGVSERLDMLTRRFTNDEVYLTESKDNAIGTDIPKAITEMKMLEFSHDVALNVGARILPRTLLDFLR